jgi:hypothetical protein
MIVTTQQLHTTCRACSEPATKILHGVDIVGHEGAFFPVVCFHPVCDSEACQGAIADEVTEWVAERKAAMLERMKAGTAPGGAREGAN